MSVRIDVGDYCLISYKHGWTYGKPESRVDSDGKVREALGDQRYAGTLSQALTALEDIWLRESGATGFEELRAELKAFRAELVSLFEIQVREPDKDKHRRSA